MVGRSLRPTKRINIGSKVNFPTHFSMVIACRKSPLLEVVTSPEAINPKGAMPDNEICPSPNLNDNQRGSSALDTICMYLDYTHGIQFEREIREQFSMDVHPTRFTGHFTLVVSLVVLTSSCLGNR